MTPEGECDITINTPLRGGYITGPPSRNLPSIQVELKRNSHTAPQWYEPGSCRICHQRLTQLSSDLFCAIQNSVTLNYQPITVGGKVA